MNITDFETKWMGRRVMVPTRLVRVQEGALSASGRWLGVDKTWVEHKEEVAGWVVGVRWLTSGRSVHIGYEEGYAWRQTGGSIPAALIATSARTKPIHVPLATLLASEVTP